jgi:type I restriction enzyme S subunit
MSSAQVKYMDSSGIEPYTEYKDSGIEWIGEIPEHWDVTKLKHSLSKLESGNRENDSNRLDNGIFSIGGEHISWDGKLKLYPPRYISKQYYDKLNGGKVLDKDILLVKDGATIGKTTFVHNQSSQKFAVNEHVYILRTNKNTLPKYLFYFIMSKIGQEQIQLQKRGAAQPGLNSGFSDIVMLSVPPFQEQQAIATFLDRETSRIDALVEKKQQFIELLEERRSALISHAVTKGLDPDVPMKDSGIEWIGEIPEHWDTIRIKHATYVKGRIGWHGLRSDEFIDEGPFLVTGTDFVNGIVNWNSCYHVSKDRYDQDPYIQLKENDLLITKDGTIGKVALVKGLKSEATLNSGIFVTRPLSNNYITDFMYWILNSEVFTAFFEYMSNGTTIQHLYQNVFNEFAFPIPPLQEQQAIANYLDRETSQIDNLIEKTEQSIEYLKEYRTALISSAVTGKIDVRGTVSD